MTFEDFAAKVVEIAGGVPCGAECGRGFNGLPDKWQACVAGSNGGITRTEAYTEPSAALAEFAGVVELVRAEHETWLLKHRIGRLEKSISELEAAP